MVRIVLVVALVAVAGCGSGHSQSCPSGSAECPGDGGTSCTRNSDCADPSRPVCDTDKKSCVQCSGSSHDLCTGATPRCEADVCVACVDDGDCGAAGVCLPTGACADPAAILHAAPGGSSTPGCGDAGHPCSLEQALVSVSANKTVIKLDAGTYTPAVSNYVVGASVMIDLRGATLHHIVDGALLEVKNNQTVSLLGGTLEGAVNGDGIVCDSGATLGVSDMVIRMIDQAGINAQSGCKLTVTAAKISETSLKANQFAPGILANGTSLTLSRSLLVANHGGGIVVNSGTFAIVGNALLNNGSYVAADGSGSPNGGIEISTAVNSANRLAFNTVARNVIQAGSKSGGIDCNAGIAVIGYYNIVWNNNPLMAGVQVSGGCKHVYSDVGPGELPSGNDGGGHILNLNPQLVNELSDPHLRMTSPTRAYASGVDVSGLAARDIDGDLRTDPADLGADQYRAP